MADARLQHKQNLSGSRSKETGRCGRWANGWNSSGMTVQASSITCMQGLGIALVAARSAQVPVTVVDNSQAAIDKGLKFAGMRDHRGA